MKPHLWIDKIIFNNDYELELENNSINVFVGPNNAGKSAVLKDINNLLINSNINNNVIVKGITLKVPFDQPTLTSYLEQFLQKDQRYSAISGWKRV